MNSRIKLYGAMAILLVVAIWLARETSDYRGSDHTSEVSESDPNGSASRESTASRRAKPHGKSVNRDFDFAAIMKMWNKGEFPKLTALEIENYVTAQNRSAESLLAAFMLGDEQAYLDEALERFPNNPQVLLASLRQCTDPAKRLELLAHLKTADPENGLIDCLAARALFDLGRNDEALTELRASAGKELSDHTATTSKNLEAAYLSAGFSPAKAKLISLYSTSKPEIMQLGDPMLRKLKELRQNCAAAGDHAEAESLRGIQLEIGSQLQRSGLLIDAFVGIIYVRQALQEVDTVEREARLQELEMRGQIMSKAAAQVSSLMGNSNVPESDWVHYFDLVTTSGELAANEWMLGKYPDP